jgi:predicted transcriptional regulator of viral defense system
MVPGPLGDISGAEVGPVHGLGRPAPWQLRTVTGTVLTCVADAYCKRYAIATTEGRWEVALVTYRKVLWEVALDQHGLVTTQDARRLGVPAVELRKLAQRGSLERVGHGVYRMVDLPRTEHEDYAAAVALVGRDAYLTHDAVLALHDLALVNPRAVRVATPHRVRLSTLPSSVKVVLRTDLGPDDVTSYDGIPSTSVAQALVDCVGLVMTSRLREAAEEARSRGLVGGREYNWAQHRLAAHGAGSGLTPAT